MTGVVDLKYQQLAANWPGTGASVPADIMWHLFGNQIILSAGQLVPAIYKGLILF